MVWHLNDAGTADSVRLTACITLMDTFADAKAKAKIKAGMYASQILRLAEYGSTSIPSTQLKRMTTNEEKDNKKMQPGGLNALEVW